MNAIITFNDDSTITVEKNGDCFISETKPDFPTNLDNIKIESKDETKVINHAQLIECASVDQRYWFTFNEESLYERTIRELREENEILEDAISELASIIGGEA